MEVEDSLFVKDVLFIGDISHRGGRGVLRRSVQRILTFRPLDGDLVA